MLRSHLFIEGKVQGVFFRQETLEHAKAYGVYGWVRNLPDGRVEVLFEGNDDAVEALIDWCHMGPPSALVRRVLVQRERIEKPKHTNFSIRY
jgi:acylphosphatase